MDFNIFIVIKPPVIAIKKAVSVLATAISIPICVAVKKKTPGFISGDERIKAIIALKGTPAEINETPIGIAAYVGSGESNPINAPAIIDII